eukprot:360477-Rhodomonas_salina.1
MKHPRSTQLPAYALAMPSPVLTQRRAVQASLEKAELVALRLYTGTTRPRVLRVWYAGFWY